MLSIEEFVSKNLNYITKEQIKKVYDTLGIDCYPLYKTKKNELLWEIRYDNIPFDKIYNILKDEQFGISVTAISAELGISKYKVNKLIENGVFKVIYTRTNQNYGKTIYCKFIRYEDVYNYYLKEINNK